MVGNKTRVGVLLEPVPVVAIAPSVPTDIVAASTSMVMSPELFSPIRLSCQLSIVLRSAIGSV